MPTSRISPSIASRSCAPISSPGSGASTGSTRATWLLESGAGLVDHEAAIVEHMNADHADAVQLYATRLLGRSGEGWRMTGIDPEGIDLRRAGDVARLAFAAPVHDPKSARAELVRLVKHARQAN